MDGYQWGQLWDVHEEWIFSFGISFTYKTYLDIILGGYQVGY
jgi:hypothetical protein